ncbi:PLD nuclease N-terminal domain-containing protein [Nesterenkonia natronophila]|nr:PLD nuclease N-terminal domain-containing protein [Nesterenkonia natronophila]
MAKKNLKQQWDNLSPSKQAGTMVLASIQLSLAVSAWADLAARPASQVNGRKGMWAVIIAVNFIGPIAYFLIGRRRS